ncbi:MAG TPA: (2Fe-2S)-binding protein [Myxococcota bacterium]|nr:(2Fe-2S)-binding protein [Myxococcota bacterium]
MIVCHCNGISDRAIRRAVRNGARSLHQIARFCAAGSGCGGCRAVIEEIMDGERSGGTESAELLSLADYAPAR